MWFASSMVVADFTVKITGFGLPELARPLLRTIVETMDRLGLDHLLVDLNRDGQDAWSSAYRRDPIMIRGSGLRAEAFGDLIVAAGHALLPEAETTVEWHAHDHVLAEIDATHREIERSSRLFGGLAGGLVPARVRLAILDPESYLEQHGAGAVEEWLRCPESLPERALRQALGVIGPRVGLPWAGSLAGTPEFLGDLHRLSYGRVDPIFQSRTTERLGASDSNDQIAVTEFVDPLMVECVDYLHAAMFDAIRDALASGLASEVAAADSAGVIGAARPSGWCGELVTSAPGSRLALPGLFRALLDPIEG